MAFQDEQVHDREQDNRSQRLAVLKNLAGQASGADGDQARAAVATATIPTPSERRTGSKRRGLLLALTSVLILALLSGAWAVKSGLLGGASQPPMPAVRTIDLTKNNLACPTDPLWSPNDAYIAVYATDGDCTTGTYDTVIAIFNARTGKLEHRFTVARLLAARGIPSGLSPYLYTWSPDSASLIFSVGYDFAQVLPPNTKHGLIIISVAHGSARFFADPTPVTSLPVSATLVWDVSSGKLVHTIPELPPAPAYSWAADGMLAPSVTADGKNSVRVWQPGYIMPVNAMGQPNLKPHAFYYVAILSSWSPDGRYLAQPLTLGAHLPGGPGLQKADYCPEHLTLVCQAPGATVPDAGFNAALAAAEAGWSQPQAQSTTWNDEEIAWRADGQELATMLPGQDFNSSQATARVTIFNTHSGQPIRTLTIQRIDITGSGSGSTPGLAWSPQGSSLAAVNFMDATLTIWRSA